MVSTKVLWEPTLSKETLPRASTVDSCLDDCFRYYSSGVWSLVRLSQGQTDKLFLHQLSQPRVACAMLAAFLSSSCQMPRKQINAFKYRQSRALSQILKILSNYKLMLYFWWELVWFIHNRHPVCPPIDELLFLLQK